MIDICECPEFKAEGDPTLIYPFRSLLRNDWCSQNEMCLWPKRMTCSRSGSSGSTGEGIIECHFDHPPRLPEWHIGAIASSGATVDCKNYKLSGNDIITDASEAASHPRVARYRESDDEERYDPALPSTANDIKSKIERIENLEGNSRNRSGPRSFFRSLASAKLISGDGKLDLLISTWRRIMAYLDVTGLVNISIMAHSISSSDSVELQTLRCCIPHLTCVHDLSSIKMTRSNETWQAIAEIPLTMMRNRDGFRVRGSCFLCAIYFECRDQGWGNEKGQYLAGYYKAEKNSLIAIHHHEILPNCVGHKWAKHSILLKPEYLSQCEVVRIYGRTGGGGAHELRTRDFGWIRALHQLLPVDEKRVWRDKIKSDPEIHASVLEKITAYLQPDTEHVLKLAFDDDDNIIYHSQF